MHLLRICVVSLLCTAAVHPLVLSKTRCSQTSRRSVCDTVAGQRPSFSLAEKLRHPCYGKGPGCTAGPHGWQIGQLLRSHNTFRAFHGACPLRYSQNLEASVLRSSRFGTLCRGGGVPDLRLSATLGENAGRIGRGSAQSTADVDPKDFVSRWYCGQERCMGTYRSRRPLAVLPELTQLLWKASTEVGCAICGSSSQYVMMCHYSPRRNTPDRFGWENLGKPGSSSSGCWAAPRAFDECSRSPCGDAAKQVCSDVDQWRTRDYRCSCVRDRSVRATGRPAVCERDSCEGNPCGKGQVCVDPDVSPSFEKDFVCTCENAPNVSSIGRAAPCPDECDAEPCGAGQVCDDPEPEVGSRGDFFCNCSNGVSAVGRAARCFADECLSKPCGGVQACEDRDTAANSLGDYVCTCPISLAQQVGGAVPVCPLDECNAAPCGQQACRDPTPVYAQQKDFICSCQNGLFATGAQAVCTIDECQQRGSTCGKGNFCRDPDTYPYSAGDWECICANNETRRSTAMPVACSFDECTERPCGTGQTCRDDTGFASNDYHCNCTNGRGSAVGSPADCSWDECEPSPCGEGQLCADTKRLTAGDFVCACQRHRGTSAVGTPVPACDECLAKPCEPNQTCWDADTTPASQEDFICTCPDGANTTGATAACTNTTQAPTTPLGAGEDTDPAVPVWGWVIIAVAGVAVGVAAVVGGFLCMRSTPPTFDRAVVSEMCEYSNEPKPQVAV